MSKITNKADLGKVAITVASAPWNANTKYEKLTQVFLDGDSYVSLKDNKNINPSTDTTGTWAKSTAHGKSLYELLNEKGLYNGTEDEFLAEWNKRAEDTDKNLKDFDVLNKEFKKTETIVKNTVDNANTAIHEAGEATNFANSAAADAEAATARANTAAANAEGIKTSLDNFIAQGGGATDAQVIKNTEDIATLGSNISELGQEVIKKADAEKVAELEGKTVKIESFAMGKVSSGVTEVGQYYFNMQTNSLYRCVSLDNNLTFEEVEFIDGAIYTYYDKLYTWDGDDFITHDEIVIKGIAAGHGSSGITETGQFYYNNQSNALYQCIRFVGSAQDSSFRKVKIVDGRCLSYNGDVYVYHNGEIKRSHDKIVTTLRKQDILSHSGSGAISNDGVTVNSSLSSGVTYWHTGYIYARAGVGVSKAYAVAASDNAYLWFYDKDFNVVGKLTSDASGEKTVALNGSNMPSNAVFFRFNFNINSDVYISPAVPYLSIKEDFADITNELTDRQIAKNNVAVDSFCTITKQASSGFKSLVKGVRKGEIYMITGTGGDGARLYSIIGGDGKTKALAKANLSATNLMLEISEDGILVVNVAVAYDYSIYMKKNAQYAVESSMLKYDISNEFVPMGISNAGNVGSAVTLSETNRNYMHAKINVKAGETYMLTSSGGSSLRTYCLQNKDNVIIEIGTAGIREEDHKICVTTDGVLSVNADPNYTYSLYKLVSGNNVEEVVNTLADKKIAEADKHAMNNEFKSVFDFAYWGGGSKTLVIPNNGNERIDFQVETTTNGFPLAMYLNYEDGEVRLLCYPYVFSGNKTVSVNLRGKLRDVIISFGSAAAQGVAKITATIHRNTVPVAIDVYTSKKYQFGRLCNYKYESPDLIDIPTHTFRSGDSIIPTKPHATGEVINTFYALYDALVSAYPHYVSKVECDVEMQRIGIEKPDYMNGLNTYMYKFIPPLTRTPDADITKIELHRPKIFITSGTHAEYEGMYDVIHMMQRVCQQWATDGNLEELRWNAEIYIMPCSAAWTDDNGIRCPFEKDESGADVRALRADPNRNASANDWMHTKPDSAAVISSHTWSGEAPADLYETKVFEHFFEMIAPDVYIDRHNAYLPTHDDNTMIYCVSKQKMALDCCNELITTMTRSWRTRFAVDNMPSNPTEEDRKCTYIFPSMLTDDTTLLGSIYGSTEAGTRQAFASDHAYCLSCTAESKQGTVYYNGQLGDDTHNYDQVNTRLIYTTGMEALINLCCRLLSLV